MVLRQGGVAPAKQVPLMQVLDWLRDQSANGWRRLIWENPPLPIVVRSATFGRTAEGGLIGQSIRRKADSDSGTLAPVWLFTERGDHLSEESICKSLSVLGGG